MAAAGCRVAASGIYWVPRVPLRGSYLSDLLLGFIVMRARLVEAVPPGREVSDPGCILVGNVGAAHQQGRPRGLPVLRLSTLVPSSGHCHS